MGRVSKKNRSINKTHNIEERKRDGAERERREGYMLRRSSEEREGRGEGY